MKIFLIALSSVLTLIAALPYLAETARGKTKPRIVSWFVWGALMAVGAGTSFTQHQLPAGVYALFCSIECIAIVILGFKKGDRSIKRLDVACLIGAAAGLLTLILVKSPTLALVISLVTDFFGAIPTIEHAWLRPHEETLSTYLLNGVAGGITLLVANLHVFSAVGYPAYLFVTDLTLAGIIFARSRRALATTEPIPQPSAASNNLLPSPVSVPNNSRYAVEASSSTPAVPPSPSNLMSASPTQVPVLSWKPVLDTQAYTIYRNGSKIATSQFPAYSDTAATENTYTYYVTASNAAGESGPSNSVSIVVDKTPPSIAYSVSTAPNANGWYNKPVTITFTAQDPKVGIASCSPPTTLDKDGVNQTVTGYAMNYVSELSRTRVVLNIDQTPPTLGVPSWSENPVKRDALVTLTVPVVDHDSGVEQGEYLQGSDPGEGKGTAMSLADGQLTLPIRAAVPPGQYKFYIRAKDAAGNWSALVKTTLVVE